MVSDRGDSYTVTARDGLTTVTADRRFSLTGHRRRLRDMGCSSFVADLSGESGEARKRVLDACIRGTALDGTSEFNFSMGLV
jgi:U32 family peptidase